MQSGILKMTIWHNLNHPVVGKIPRHRLHVYKISFNSL